MAVTVVVELSGVSPFTPYVTVGRVLLPLYVIYTL